jgi:hypothetical protein
MRRVVSPRFGTARRLRRSYHSSHWSGGMVQVGLKPPPQRLEMFARATKLACEACGGLALGNPAQRQHRGCRALPNSRDDGARQQRAIALTGPTVRGQGIALCTGRGSDRGAPRVGASAHPGRDAIRAKAGRRCHPVPRRRGDHSSGHHTISNTAATHARGPRVGFQGTDPKPADAMTSSARRWLRTDLSKRKKGFFSSLLDPVQANGPSTRWKR